MISVLGMNIKKLREEKGLSAYKLAKLAKVGTATVYEIEDGTSQGMKDTTLKKIAEALKVSVNDLYELPIGEEIEVSDVETIMKAIFQSEEMTLDDVELNNKEKEKILNSIQLTLEMIRKDRKIN